MREAIVLCSGGLDSVTTAYLANSSKKYSHITILFFNYGQRTLQAERRCSRVCAKHLKATFTEIDLPWLAETSTSLLNSSEKANNVSREELKDSSKESKNWYVPCRNQIFLSHALALAERRFLQKKVMSDILVGFKSEGRESYPDTTPEFVKQMNTLSKLSTLGKFIIKAPVITKDKEDIVLLARKLGVPLNQTFSCYVSPKEHCGYCLSCRLRQEGFYWANVRDSTEYMHKPKDFRTGQQ